jgi:hypothetical protein
VIVTLRIDSETPVGHAHNVISQLQAYEFKQFHFEVAHDEPIVGVPAESGAESKSRQH